jgi:hypothetical protein
MPETRAMRIPRQRLARLASLVAIFGLLALLLAPTTMAAGGGGSDPGGRGGAAISFSDHYCDSTGKDGAPAKNGRQHCCIFCGSSGRLDDVGPYLFATTHYNAALPAGVATLRSWPEYHAPPQPSRRRSDGSSRAPPLS